MAYLAATVVLVLPTIPCATSGEEAETELSGEEVLAVPATTEAAGAHLL